MNAIILSGGKGSRIGYREKAFLKLGKDTFIGRKIKLLKQFFEEIIIVANKPGLYKSLGVKVVKDEKEGVGPLMGLYTGLKNSSAKLNFATTSDTPFLKKNLIQYLIKNAKGCDVLVPRWQGNIEPLCAVYSRRCIPYIKRALKYGSVRSFYRSVNVKYVSQSIIKKIDPRGLSFFNVNTLKDYDKARTMGGKAKC